MLKFFDPAKLAVLHTDASSAGLGTCLLQEGHPVTYASRSLTPAEQNYAQIEKELLGILFGTERFHQYIYGFDTTVHTDHKPLVAIVKKPLHLLSPRLQLIMLPLLRYTVSVQYIPGKYLYIADTLSRVSSSLPLHDQMLEDDIHLHVHQLVGELPVSTGRMKVL